LRSVKRNIKDYATEAGEYLGTMQFISEGVDRGYLNVDYIKKIIDERLIKWQRIEQEDSDESKS